ncbi:MAG: ATP-binding protein [Acidimicrobiia bacterium]
MSPLAVSLVVGLPALLILVIWIVRGRAPAAPAVADWEVPFRAAGYAVAIVDGSNLIVRANQALAVMTGIEISDAVGRPISEVLHDYPLLNSLLSESRATGESRSGTDTGMGNRFIELTVAPLLSGGTDRLGVLVRDVSEQKWTESHIVQSERMAAIGHVVAGVAHELNNPLAAIAGLSDFLLEGQDLPADEREHLGVIHEQAERASKIVRNLLSFAREGAGKTTSVDLNDVVERTFFLVSYELRLREVGTEVDLDPDLPPIKADKSRVQQIVLNLLTNAYQALDSPEVKDPTIRVRTLQHDNSVLLRISDNGPGVPEETADRIFDPFFTTKDATSGTGFGLAICRDIAKEFGGGLTLDRDAEGGATFEVSFPIPEDDALQATEGAAQEQPAARASGGKARRVLLVDDDPAVRNTLDVIFSDRGLKVTAADSAEHACKLLARKKFDVIIADPRSTVSSGPTFAERLVAEWPKLTKQTIMLTADVRRETAEWLGALGFRYFHKPFDVSELTAAIDELTSD